MTKYLCGLALSLALVPLGVAQENNLQKTISVFDYDPKAPLDLHERVVEDHDGVQVHDITYESPKGGPVPAYLVVPAGKGPFAGIVFVHWGQGNRAEFLDEALLLARTGAVSLLIDAPFTRPSPWRSSFDDPQGYIQLVVDCRRAVDVLVSRPEVDPQRIAYVGHSVGATWGGAIAVAERRFKALVLMAGLPALSEFGRTHMLMQEREKEEQNLAAIAPYDAVNLIGHAAPAAIFFQFARLDQWVPRDEALRYERAASEPKLVRWYEGSHEFTNVRALPDRADFLHYYVGIAPLRSILVRELQSDTLIIGSAQPPKP